MTHYEQAPLWVAAFSHAEDGFDAQRDSLIQAYEVFRDRVGKLLQLIASELPALTVHDITHVDALWHVASEIAGHDYPLNPAEAFVLGGAFLLHDAAHCRAAFSGGLDEIRALPEWSDAAAQRGLDLESLVTGTEDFQAVLFDVLRVLHPKRARGLPEAYWLAPGDDTPMKLLPHDELRQAYGAVIGEIAESHWWATHNLESMAKRSLPPPVSLRGTGWDVDILKIALLLRTADAAHIDADRAPRFLFALNKPTGVSRGHWTYQSKLNPGRCNPQRNELRIAGGPFRVSEQDAWWLAYDTSLMIDGELAAADELLRDSSRKRFVARAVEGAHHPEAFARNVTVAGWHPVDASVRITDITRVVEQFGGRNLYGDKPYLALRELLQNARDAVLACRALGGLGPAEGRIDVEINSHDGADWLHVTDTGIGMSRYVLTKVLLDFGRSFWRDQSVRNEWPGLASSGFEAVGQFGVGFFSVFMLGDEVKVATRRFERSDDDEQNQWVLEFPGGSSRRPVLRTPTATEKLKRHGTRVSVRLSAKTDLLQSKKSSWDIFSGIFGTESISLSLCELVGYLAPALEVDLWVTEDSGTSSQVLQAGDWRSIDALDLLTRIAPDRAKKRPDWMQRMVGSSADGLDRICNSNGDCWGRCAVADPTLSFLAATAGVVTVGGLLGGEISGFNGLLTGLPQDRLDRSSAIPSAPLSSISEWADRQARFLLGKSQLTRGHSKILIALGADPEELLAVEHNGRALSTKQLRETIADCDEIWLLSERDRGYDSDDPVTKSDFETHFEFDSRVFVVDLTKSQNAFVITANWPPETNSAGPRCPGEVVNLVVNQVWPNAGSEEDQERSVGNVLGESIIRNVIVVRRRKSG